MSTKNSKLYFVALVPTEDVLRKVQKLKEEVAERFESKAALKSPPHITLHMPFKFREDRESKISNLLSKFSADQRSFPVHQKGFGSFPPRVIFVNVEETQVLYNLQSDLVRLMRRELVLENANYKDQPFHPHMTIAFRDLKKRVFKEAWAHFSEQHLNEEWKCEQISLLKHNGIKWEILENCAFG